MPIRHFRSAHHDEMLAERIRRTAPAVGIDALPPYPFACECGGSGCTAT